MTLVNFKWLIERDGELKDHWPDGRVTHDVAVRRTRLLRLTARPGSAGQHSQAAVAGNRQVRPSRLAGRTPFRVTA